MSLVRRRTADADYLGLQTVFPGVRLAAASFKTTPESRQSLELVQYLSHAGPPGDPGTNRAGIAHLCLLVDDLSAAYDQLRQRGVRFHSPPVLITSGPNQGGWVVYLFDPDGFTVELFQPPAVQPE
jgi:catechol 2,3-dioxygenase-like lactoylglutathione lyase family enzyme